MSSRMIPPLGRKRWETWKRVVMVVMVLLMSTDLSAQAFSRNPSSFLRRPASTQRIDLERQPRSSSHAQSKKKKKKKTSLNLMETADLLAAWTPASWEDGMYQVQSMAGSWTSNLLQRDPANLLTSLPTMYAAGLLTSFSPCVWGLLPLTLSYISTAAGERPDQRTTWPTLAFAAGLALVFGGLGVAAASAGGVLGSHAASSTEGGGGGWSALAAVLPILSHAICVAMGLKLLELIQLPLLSLDFLQKAWQQSAAAVGAVPTTGSSTRTRGGNQAPILLDGTGQMLSSSSSSSTLASAASATPRVTGEAGSLLRTFFLGGSSALVASPCATPVLTSILAYVASSQNPVLGAILLLGYTLGYSTPLLIVASTGGQALVRLKQQQPTSSPSSVSSSSGQTGLASLDWYGKIAPWVTPLTGGILLWYGTQGLLTTIWGDPSLAGLGPVLD